MFTRIHHVGIACHDLEKTAAFYEETFGLTLVWRARSDEYGLVEAMLRAGNDESGSYVQLLQPLAADTQVGRFLARRGEGIHHIGYEVNDLRAALAELGRKGVRLIDESPRHGSMRSVMAFLHPKAVGGVLTELVDPDGVADQ
jgi:methylmalonyl-CoA/ethylmalonyl-CoA epimerase